MVCSDTHDTLKGHCLDKAHVRSCDNIFFLPIKIVILSLAPRIRPESAWSFNCLSKISYLLTCKEYFSFLCCVKAVSVEYKYKHLTFFQLAMHISDVLPPIFSLLFSSLRKPPLEESAILEGIQPQNSR